MKVLDKREDNERLWVESWWFFLRLGHIIHLICVSQNRLTLWSGPLPFFGSGLDRRSSVFDTHWKGSIIMMGLFFFSSMKAKKL